MEKQEVNDNKGTPKPETPPDTPFLGIELDDKGNLAMRSNISNKMMIKHILEVALERVVKDLTEGTKIIYVPDAHGMPIRRN